MKKIIIYFILTIVLIIHQYFLSIILVFQLATKGEGSRSFGFKDGLIICIWLIGAVSIIYMIIKFLISIYRHE